MSKLKRASPATQNKKVENTPPSCKMFLFFISKAKTRRWRMKHIIQRFGRAVKGILTGFDRIVFKGSILPLTHEEGAMSFCGHRGILNKDYKSWMMEQTEALVEAVDKYAKEQCGRGITHLNTWRHDKDKLAEKRREKEGIDSGLIGVWSCLESGRSYRARYSAEAGYPQLRHYRTQCKHIYQYFDDEDYGLMNVRLQTWFPYHIQVCMNGRHWLRRTLEKKNIRFYHKGNKLVYIEDHQEAQSILDDQPRRQWPGLLDRFLPGVFPTMRQTLGSYLNYYWTMWQSEWATDILFDRPETVQSITDDLMRHAFITGTANRILRYMDRPLTLSGQPYKSLPNDIVSRFMDFQEGIRVRHWVDRNSVKVYNEQNVLRIETTMNAPEMFKVYRRAQGEPSTASKKLRQLRKGVADVPLRASVSQQINNRFMDNLAAFPDQTPLRDLLGDLTRPFRKNGRRIRALEPTSKDRELLEALNDPAFSLSGITNACLRKRLSSTAWGRGRTDKQLSARISRHLRLLRDHGLIRKLPNRRRYHLTNKGRKFITAVSSALAASTQQLMKMAA